MNLFDFIVLAVVLLWAFGGWRGSSRGYYGIGSRPYYGGGGGIIIVIIVVLLLGGLL